LQEWQQSGIPIVYRFLAEYVSTRWNGSDFFLEILRLIAYLPITEFEGKNLNPINEASMLFEYIP